MIVQVVVENKNQFFNQFINCDYIFTVNFSQGRLTDPYASISDLSKIWGTTTITSSCILDKMENDEEDQSLVDQPHLVPKEYLLKPSLEYGDNYKCANWCVDQHQ